MTLNWDAVGAIAEAVGTVAIFFSLIYMAIQIRLNTKELSRSVEAERLAAFERNIESGNRARELLITYPDLAATFLQGLAASEPLLPAEKFRFELLLRNIFSSIQGAYIRQRSVSHDPQDFAGTAALLDSILINPGARRWLEKSDPDWRPEFRQFVEDRARALERRKSN